MLESSFNSGRAKGLARESSDEKIRGWDIGGRHCSNVRGFAIAKPNSVGRGDRLIGINSHAALPPSISEAEPTSAQSRAQLNKSQLLTHHFSHGTAGSAPDTQPAAYNPRRTLRRL